MIPYPKTVLEMKIRMGNGVDMIQGDHDVDGENYGVMILGMEQVPEYLAWEEFGRWRMPWTSSLEDKVCRICGMFFEVFSMDETE